MRCTCTKQNETPIIQLVRSTKRKRSDPYLLQIRRISSSRSSFLISSRYWSPGLNRIDGCQFGDPSFPFNQKLLHFLNKTEAEGAQHNLRRQFIDRSSSHLIATCSWSSSGPNERKTAFKLHMNRVSCNRSFPRIYYCAQIIPILRKPWARITISLFSAEATCRCRSSGNDSRVDRCMVREYAEKMQIKCDICMRSAEPRSIAMLLMMMMGMGWGLSQGGWWSLNRQQQCMPLRENNFGNNQICMSRSDEFNIDRGIDRWMVWLEEERKEKKKPKMIMSIIKENQDHQSTE